MYPFNQLQQDPYVPGPFDNCWAPGEQLLLEQDNAAHAQYQFTPRAPPPPPATPVPEPPVPREPRTPAALCRNALGVLKSRPGFISRPQVSLALYMALFRPRAGNESTETFVLFDHLGFNQSGSSMRAFNNGTYGTFPYIPDNYSRSTLETLDPFGSDPTIAEIPAPWIQRLRNWVVRALAAVGRIRIVTGADGLQVVRLVDEAEVEIAVPPGLLLIAAERVAAEQDADRIAAEVAAERLATEQRLAAQRTERAAGHAAVAVQAAEGVGAELAAEQPAAIAASHCPVPAAATTSVTTTLSSIRSEVSAVREFTLAQTRLLDQLRRHGEVVEAESLGLPKPPRREPRPDPFAVRANNTRAVDCYCGSSACLCYHATVPGPVKRVAKRAKAPLVLTSRGLVIQPRFATGQQTAIGFNHPTVTSGLNTLVQDSTQIAGASRIQMDTRPHYQHDSTQIAGPSRITLDMLAQQDPTQIVGVSRNRLVHPGLSPEERQRRLELILEFCPGLNEETDDEDLVDTKHSADKRKAIDRKQQRHRFVVC